MKKRMKGAGNCCRTWYRCRGDPEPLEDISRENNKLLSLKFNI